MTYANENETVFTSLLSQQHGRERRHERGIEKVDLQRARRYGMKERARNGCHKYTYGGVVFIYDPKSRREVTSWKSSDEFVEGCGTRWQKPIVLPKVPTTYQMIQDRAALRKQLLADKNKWSSHSILVVDMSGSMRRDDVNGARCRSDGVWMSLARDYVKVPLENKSRSGTDLISIVVMRESAEILLACEPTDWSLYNKLVELREWEEIRPSGYGCYMPALELSQKLLNLNTKGSCALALLFFSDGRPSDFDGDHKGKMGEIASIFGRRLTITCIGMAAEKDEGTFATLQSMAHEADSYGSIASFGSAALDTDSLSKIVSSLATSLTETKTEMTDLVTGKKLSVRMDFKRERKDLPDDLFLSDDWKVFSGEGFGRTWVWSYRHNNYVEMFDFRCIACNKDTRASSDSTDVRDECRICPTCRSACFCSARCFAEGYSDHVNGSFNLDRCMHLQRAAIEKRILKRPVLSYSLAIKKKVFGEGAERIVSKLRYLDQQNVFRGPRLVAKESRHIEDENASYQKQEQFHRTFMRTQAIASEMAKRFNKDVDALSGIISDRTWHEFVRKLPRIHFLETSVVEVYDEKSMIPEYYLIEPFLDGKYTKFNSNNGYVKGGSRKNGDVDIDQNEFGSKNPTVSGEVNENDFPGVDLAAMIGKIQIEPGLDIIEEGDESDVDSNGEEDGEDQNGDDNIFGKDSTAKANQLAFIYNDLKDEYFPQAFSHYSYVKSRQRLMVVDLQGVLEKQSSGTKNYRLTDPVIHRRKHAKGVKWNFGRTDRGDKGIRAFFASHKCSDVCRALSLPDMGDSTSRLKYERC